MVHCSAGSYFPQIVFWRVVISTHNMKTRWCVFLTKILNKIDYLMCMYLLSSVTVLNCAEWDLRCWIHWMYFVVKEVLNVNLTYLKGSAEQLSTEFYSKGKNEVVTFWLVVGYLLLWHSELVLVSLRAAMGPHPHVVLRW